MVKTLIHRICSDRCRLPFHSTIISILAPNGPPVKVHRASRESKKPIDFNLIMDGGPERTELSGK